MATETSPRTSSRDYLDEGRWDYLKPHIEKIVSYTLTLFKDGINCEEFNRLNALKGSLGIPIDSENLE